MKHLILFLIALCGLSGCYLPSEEARDPQGTDDMARRTNEDKPVRNDSELTPVAVITPSAGWWTGSNNVGTEVAFAPDSTNRQTILRLPEIGAPEEWTVSLYLTAPPEDVLYSAFHVTARVEFGVGGSTQVVEIDWLNGAQITVPANALNIIAEYDEVDARAAGIRLGVQVARGRRGGNAPPRLTIITDSLEPGGNRVFPIPAFASRLVAVPAGNGAADVNFYSADIDLRTISGDTFGAFDVSSATGTQLLQTDGGIPVVGAARFVTISNTGANQVPFTLYAEIFG